VMSTPELVELTLSHLPMRDLLVTVPLVSKTWQAITLTPALQRALFFLPQLTASKRVRNPLLIENFHPFFAREAPNCRGWPDAKAIQKMPWSKASDAFRRPEASWRRMLVTQPPSQSMVVSVISNGGHSEQRAVLKDLSLRMGTLYDL
ncbi:hypothetical protein K438DRAFT_1420560, partial [Mycena galopus ATCC 62051]